MTMNHEIAVDVAVHQGRAFIRDRNPRHLDTIENLLQTVPNPALFTTEVVTGLGRENALACGFDPKLIKNCIRLRREREAMA